METIIYQNEEISISDKFLKFGDKTYSLEIINGTKIEFDPLPKLQIWCSLVLSAIGVITILLPKISGIFALLGIIIFISSIYCLFKNEYALKILISDNKEFSTVVSKDISYLKEIDTAFQLALNKFVEQKIQDENN